MNATLSPFETRFEAALGHGDPTALTDLALELKREGATQTEVYDLFLHQLRKHMSSRDDGVFQRISAVMDAIAGRCDKAQWIFEHRL